MTVLWIFRSKIGIFYTFFKILWEKGFEDFKKSITIENFKLKPVPLCPLKWRSFKFLQNYTKILIANIVKSAVSCQRHFLASGKMMKNAVYLFLKELFLLKVFKFLSSRFGYVEKTTWLER